MTEETRVMQVEKTFKREAEDGKVVDTIILKKKGDEWVYHAPNAQDHTLEQVEQILAELRKLQTS